MAGKLHSGKTLLVASPANDSVSISLTRAEAQNLLTALTHALSGSDGTPGTPGKKAAGPVAVAPKGPVAVPAPKGKKK